MRRSWHFATGDASMNAGELNSHSGVSSLRRESRSPVCHRCGAKAARRCVIAAARKPLAGVSSLRRESRSPVCHRCGAKAARREPIRKMSQRIVRNEKGLPLGEALSALITALSHFSLC